jgi:hypothetical protein
VTEEILDEKGTEISVGTHDQDAARALARHGAIIPFRSKRKCALSCTTE